MSRAGLFGSWVALGIALSACARFPKNEAAEPVPAASPNNGLRESDENISMPPAIASEEDYVVRVVVGPVTCSGALIEQDQVLTAHHCIAERTKDGDMLPRDVSADRIRIELGGDDLPWGEVGVRAVVAPTCGHAAGDGDITVLVLERPLVGVATRPVRLDRPPQKGEHIHPIGFGRCALSADGIHRKHREGGAVDMIAGGRFRLNAAICPGDSGGPAVSADRGEIVGVISASVMDGNEQTLGRSEFIRLDHWRSVFGHAKAIGSGVNPSELPPIECSKAEK